MEQSCFSAKEREEDRAIPVVLDGGARAELWTPQTERALGPGPASKHSSPRRLGLAALPGWGRQGTKGPDPVIV